MFNLELKKIYIVNLFIGIYVIYIGICNLYIYREYESSIYKYVIV